jgi:hypothetical protein
MFQDTMRSSDSNQQRAYLSIERWTWLPVVYDDRSTRACPGKYPVVFDQIGRRVGADALICSKLANEMLSLVQEFTA